MTTSKTRGGTREFKIYKCHPKALPHDGKLPTYSQVSLAVSFELQHTEAAFNMQEKTAVSTVATQVLQSWGGLTNIETTRQDNLETKIKKLRQVERESVKNEDPKALKKRETLEKQGKELFDISKISQLWEKYFIFSNNFSFTFLLVAPLFMMRFPISGGVL